MMTIIENFRSKFSAAYDNATAIVISPSNRFYLTQFSSSDGIVLITEKDNYLIVDFRYYEMAKAKCKDFRVVLSEVGLLRTAKEICEKENVKCLVAEDNYLSVSLNRKLCQTLSDIEFQYFGNFIEDLRAVKTKQELNYIEQSQKLTDEAFSHVLNFLRRGVTESEVAAEIEHFIKKNGGEAAFKTIAVSGKKSSCPHGEPADVVLTDNSFLTMDFGAKLDGYCSDMTRTVVIGKANENMHEIYDTVLEAQNKALEVIKKDVLGCDVDSAAREYISKKGYGKAFGHSTGHGLGIDVHETPSFSAGFRSPIPENAVLSVEPGIYIEGRYGVRIEDIVVVTQDGYKNLTSSDKKMIEIY